MRAEEKKGRKGGRPTVKEILTPRKRHAPTTSIRAEAGEDKEEGEAHTTQEEIQEATESFWLWLHCPPLGARWEESSCPLTEDETEIEYNPHLLTALARRHERARDVDDGDLVQLCLGRGELEGGHWLSVLVVVRG